MRELAARYLNGAATEAEVARLSELLRADQGAREEYLRLADVHARLAADTSLWTHERPRNQTVPRWKGWLLPFAAAAAGVRLTPFFGLRKRQRRHPWPRCCAPRMPCGPGAPPMKAGA